MCIIEKLKEESYKQEITSEELFGINNPPEYQCPKINSIIDDFDRAMKEINFIINSDDIDDIKNAAENAEYYLRDLDYKMEKLRSAIEQLRYWGQDWKDNFKWLVNQLSEDQVRYIFDFKND